MVVVQVDEKMLEQLLETGEVELAQAGTKLVPAGELEAERARRAEARAESELEAATAPPAEPESEETDPPRNAPQTLAPAIDAKLQAEDAARAETPSP